MATYGYKLMSEEHGPKELVRNACRAEETGFDFVAISDHFHPWLESQAHSPFAWTVLGALAARTKKLRMVTAVTCPTLRYHPAIVAQFAATLGVLSDGRFTLGLGAGENLNEHVVGRGWPPPHTRQEMLGEAIDIMRKLWQGEEVSYHGEHFTLDRAKLWDVPDTAPALAVAAGGPKAARRRARTGQRQARRVWRAPGDHPSRLDAHALGEAVTVRRMLAARLTLAAGSLSDAQRRAIQLGDLTL
jgi:G6PDH family F420-dependent oxidoreductase